MDTVRKFEEKRSADSGYHSSSAGHFRSRLHTGKAEGGTVAVTVAERIWNL